MQARQIVQQDLPCLPEQRSRHFGTK